MKFKPKGGDSNESTAEEKAEFGSEVLPKTEGAQHLPGAQQLRLN